MKIIAILVIFVFALFELCCGQGFGRGGYGNDMLGGRGRGNGNRGYGNNGRGNGGYGSNERGRGDMGYGGRPGFGVFY